MLRAGASVCARESAAGFSGVGAGCDRGFAAGPEDRGVGGKNAAGEVGSGAKCVSACGEGELKWEAEEDVEFPV